MPKLSEMKNNDLIRCFVMGAPGTGKTIFASTFPGPIKYFDFDGKLNSAYSYWKNKNPKILEQIDYEDMKPIDRKGGAYAKMNQILGDIKKDYQKSGTLPYKTIVIDSLTVMAPEMLNWLVHFETGIKRNKDIKSMVIPCMQDYMVFSPTFQNFIFELFALPWNIVMTGHINVSQDELTGEIHRTPAIPGQMANKLPVYFPEVYVSVVKQDKYMLQTKADYKFPCRTQLQGAPKEIESSYQALTKFI